MSKIICDICGTAYPETGKQCPICGCVRPGDVQRVTNEVKSNGKVSTGYTYVKGGRFSKSNVKKRSQAESYSGGKGESPAPKKGNEENGKPNRGLVITAIILLLAIIGVVVFIAVRFFGPISNTGDPQGSVSNVACIDLKLDSNKMTLTVGDTSLLTATPVPGDVSDAITYVSADEAIATVSNKGLITAVAEGTTDITVTCGKVSKKCTVECKPVEESTGMTIPDITAPSDGTEPQETFRLNRNELTLKKGGSWELYSGNIDKTLIQWSSDDEKVATVKDGKVVAVGLGTTTVHAEYEGQKVSCPVTCESDEDVGVGGNGGVSEDGGNAGIGGNGGVSEDGGNGGVSEDGGTSTDSAYAVYTIFGKVAYNDDNGYEFYDLTMSVGESFELFLKDASGNRVNVEWTSGDDAITASGGTVKAVSKTGGTMISATHDGVTYKCRILVHK